MIDMKTVQGTGSGSPLRSNDGELTNHHQPFSSPPTWWQLCHHVIRTYQSNWLRAGIRRLAVLPAVRHSRIEFIGLKLRP